MKIRTIAIIPILALALSSLVACGGGKSASNTATEASTAPMASGAMQNGNATIPNCGAVQAVWVNMRTKVYHEPGDPMYGKTKHGAYLCPNQAKERGFRPAGEKKHQGAM